MTSFANLTPAERALVINESAGRLGLAPLIVEKDFWVCWTLARVFEANAVAPHVVFKGGTSLSKVFGAIRRFSEDIDLAVSPGVLGFSAAELDEAPSASQRRKRVQALAVECEGCVSERFQPALEAAIAARLGVPQQTGTWLRYEIDALAATPNLLFTYPSALAQAGGYIAKLVKLEFGALTDQQPTGVADPRPLRAPLCGLRSAVAPPQARRCAYQTRSARRRGAPQDSTSSCSAFKPRNSSSTTVPCIIPRDSVSGGGTTWGTDSTLEEIVK